jgi:hypothetical protein
MLWLQPAAHACCGVRRSYALQPYGLSEGGLGWRHPAPHAMACDQRAVLQIFACSTSPQAKEGLARQVYKEKYWKGVLQQFRVAACR